MKLLLDANLSPEVARLLKEAGHDAIHVGDVGLLSAPDPQILAADWRADYNANHPHSALGMMSPARFAASWQRIGTTNGSVNPGLSLGVDR